MFKKLRYELKILIFLEVTIAVILIMINLVFVISYKQEMENYLRKEINLYLHLLNSNESIAIPKYLKIEDDLLVNINYSLFQINNNKYVFIRTSYFKNKIKNKIYLILYWDLIALLSVAILYYILLHRFILTEKNYQKNFEIMLLIISHKLRNFMTSSKINLQLMETDNQNAFERLKKSHKVLETDVKYISTFLKSLPNSEFKPVKINIARVIKNILDEFPNLDEKVIRVNTKNVNIIASKYDIYFSFYLLFDNLMKYSNKNAFIRCGEINKLKYFIIKNDIKNDIEEGLGVGLNAAEKIFEKYNFKMKYRIKKNSFVVSIKF